MTTFVTFKDLDPWHRRDNTDFNKVGYVTQAGMVVHLRWRRGIGRTSLAAIAMRRHKVVTTPEWAADASVETFFTGNHLDIGLFNRGMNAAAQRDAAFFRDPIKMPILEPLDVGQRETRWSEFRVLLDIGDIIFVRDTSGLISRLIASVDQGTWSHVGTYSGDGQILEATASGVVERSIEAYRPPRYRLGLYRPIAAQDAPPNAKDLLIRILRAEVGKPYNYRGVTRLAFKKILGIHPAQPTRRDRSPNDLARLENMRLIYVV